MTLRITATTFDCADAKALGQFWGALLGWNVFFDEDPEVLVAPTYPPVGMSLLFIPAPEAKAAKNRIQLDLTPEASTRDEQVDLALSLGARMIDDRRTISTEGGWAVLADPEGNEFCILKSDAERPPKASRTFRLGTP